jgi:hypothetical protein
MTTEIEKFSASHLKELEICPGFRPKEFSENEYTIEGKMLHDCLEHPEDLIKRSSLTQEQLDQLTTVETITAPLLAKAKSVQREIKFPLPELVDVPELRNCILDLILENEEYEYHVLDYKFGRKRVDHADNNIQLAVYAAATLLMYPKAQRVKVTVIQPRLGVDGITERTYDWKEDFLPIVDRVKGIIKKAKDPCSLRVAHNDVCKFCANYFDCDKVQKLITKAQETPCGVFPLKQGDIAQMLHDPVCAERVLDFAKFCEEWSKQAKQAIEDRVKNGKMELGGYKLVNVKGRKTVIDSVGFRSYVIGKIGLTAFEDIAQVGLKEGMQAILATQKCDEKELQEDLQKYNIVGQAPGYSYLKAIR